MIINLNVFGEGGGGQGGSDPTKLDVAVFEEYKTTNDNKNSEQDDSISELNDKIGELQLFKYPNVTIIGNDLQINEGQVEGFNSDNYMQFPFLVDLRNKDFEINMCFTPYMIMGQHNIFDSDFGLAFAIRNRKFVVAVSNNGESWDGEHESDSDFEIDEHKTYYTRLIRQNDEIRLEVSTDGEFYDTVISFNADRFFTPFPKQIVIGKSFDGSNSFDGTINLNNCSLKINNNVVWSGMDDAGLSTRLATDLSNIDEGGVDYINNMIDKKIGDIDELLSKI